METFFDNIVIAALVAITVGLMVDLSRTDVIYLFIFYAIATNIATWRVHLYLKRRERKLEQ